MFLCRCQAYLDQLVEKHPDIVTRESLGKSIQGRQLDMVTITQPEEAGEVVEREREVKKRTILVMSRQQPGESPASYVVQGRLDTTVTLLTTIYYLHFICIHVRSDRFPGVQTQNSRRAEGEIDIQSELVWQEREIFDICVLRSSP